MYVLNVFVKLVEGLYCDLWAVGCMWWKKCKLLDAFLAQGKVAVEGIVLPDDIGYSSDYSCIRVSKCFYRKT